MQGIVNPLARSGPAVYATDGTRDPETDSRAKLEASPGSFDPVSQPGDAATIVGRHPSLTLPVFPDGPGRS